MCRLFAQISPTKDNAKDLLTETNYSLLRQADGDAKNPQQDGWGLAWFDADGRPRVRKSGRSAAVEKEKFIEASRSATSNVVLGHLRAASNPHLDDAHAHPFTDDGWTFIHNGTLTIAEEVADAMGPRKGRIHTKSDSEVYFQQFLKHLAIVGNPAGAFKACIEENWSLWASCRDRYPDVTTPYTGLNAIASEGKSLHAVCHGARRGTATHGIFHSDQPWGVMSFAWRDRRFVIASEGVDGGDWSRFSPPEVISAVARDSVVEIVRHPLELKGLNGPVPEVSRS